MPQARGRRLDASEDAVGRGVFGRTGAVRQRRLGRRVFFRRSGRGRRRPPAAAPGLTRPAAGSPPDVCAAYTEVATTGRTRPPTVALLRRSARRRCPTGSRRRRCSSRASGHAVPARPGRRQRRGDRRDRHPVRVAWFTGGHDGGGPGPRPCASRSRTGSTTTSGTGGDPDRVHLPVIRRARGCRTRRSVHTVVRPTYPGLGGATDGPAGRLPLIRQPQQPIANPPGGNPAAISSLPGLGGRSAQLAGGSRRRRRDMPGQNAQFRAAPVDRAVDGRGAPRCGCRWRACRASPAREAVLFVKLYDVDPTGTRTLLRRSVAPVRLPGCPPTGAGAVTVTLPGVVARSRRAHARASSVATTDQALRDAAEPAVYRVGVPADAAVPTVRSCGHADRDTGAGACPLVGSRWCWSAALVAGVWWRACAGRPAARHAATRRRAPLVVTDLARSTGRLRAVDGRVVHASSAGRWSACSGPNGAGKTTTLRVLMGLIRPDRRARSGLRRTGCGPARRCCPGSARWSRGRASCRTCPARTNLRAVLGGHRPAGRGRAHRRGAGDRRARRRRWTAGCARTATACGSGWRSRRPCSACPSCWCWTSRPTGSTRRRSPMRGVLAGTPPTAGRCWSPATCWPRWSRPAPTWSSCTTGRWSRPAPVDEIVGGRRRRPCSVDVPEPGRGRAVRARRRARACAVDGAVGDRRHQRHAARRGGARRWSRAGVGVDRVGPRRRLEDAFLPWSGGQDSRDATTVGDRP